MFLCSVSHSNKPGIQGGGCGNFQFIASWSEAQVTSQTCDWQLKRGAGLQD